jgi:hypothetical protein
VTPNDQRFVLYARSGRRNGLLHLGGDHAREKSNQPQVVIDHDGIVLGFGRNQRFAWSEILWVRQRHLGFRPQLQIALVPEAFMRTDLRLSMWNLDDGLRPVRGSPAAVAVRDNGLDARASAMLDAVRGLQTESRAPNPKRSRARVCGGTSLACWPPSAR